MASSPPHPAEAQLKQGNEHYVNNKFTEAVAHYSQAIALAPHYAEAYYNRAMAFERLAHIDDALRDYDQSLGIRPTVDTYNNKGSLLLRLKRYAEALQCYDSAVLANPDYAIVYNNRSVVLQKMKRYSEALDNLNKAISLKPDYVDAYINKGSLLQIVGDIGGALECFDKAIALNPSHAAGYNNRSVILHRNNRHTEALANLEKALAINPNYAGAYLNKGHVLQKLGRFDEAMACFDTAIALDPNSGADWNKALLLLLLGQFEEGWQLYESRHDVEEIGARNLPTPLWLGGASLNGKTILLYAEQGLGDTIQFCRYVPMVKALGANVILEVPLPLISLLFCFENIAQVIATGSTLPEYDFHCPLLSLPLAFGTRADSIPANIPYLTACKDKQDEWKARLGTTSRKRIGLCWSGAAIHNNDRNRSIALELFAPLFEIDAEFYVLQTEIRASDEKTLHDHNNRIKKIEALKDFSDTAALILEMDLVISVDTSIAHLAGALGKPLWLLLPFAPDFRWMIDREDSPWYPTAKLFRQPQTDDWKTVIDTVNEALKRS